MSANEAEKKFWRTPELVEGLLPLLDPPSTLALAQAHPLTVGVMEATHNMMALLDIICERFPPVQWITLDTVSTFYNEFNAQFEIDIFLL